MLGKSLREKLRELHRIEAELLTRQDPRPIRQIIDETIEEIDRDIQTLEED